METRTLQTLKEALNWHETGTKLNKLTSNLYNSSS